MFCIDQYIETFIIEEEHPLLILFLFYYKQSIQDLNFGRRGIKKVIQKNSNEVWLD
jgi:hypothetical protein